MPYFRILPEKMIVPLSILQRVFKNNYLTIRSSADSNDNQYIRGIWETVSPKFRNPLENNDELVRYATAGMADDIFISKYKVVLLLNIEMEKFVEEGMILLKGQGGEQR
jgi:hypothetical protein